MKLIITESQYRVIVENGIRDRVFNVLGELLEDKDSFYKMYKLYKDNKESKNYVGIRVFGDFNLMGVLGGKLSSELIDFCNNLVQVDGDLKVINNYIVDFPKLRSVASDMLLSMADVRSLSELRYVGGDLTLKRSKVSELPELESIGGCLDLERSQINSLPKLESVGGFLDLNYSKIESLPKLESVGEDLYLENTPLFKKTTEEELRSKINVRGNIFL